MAALEALGVSTIFITILIQIAFPASGATFYQIHIQPHFRIFLRDGCGTCPY
ncbi:hypothetical protein Dehly_0855 [Dehalogenimonas lykanthroporepellens BL-DC-9]|nr:hypothetical protein Dehly_0855 [Dehalogenimonas lykanthroporepellens BL-DC-9]